VPPRGVTETFFDGLLGIVQQAGTAKRDRVYCAKALLDILEEPAQLVPGSH
jgi:hypothetical protein